MHTLWNEKRIIIDGNIMCIVSVLARAIRYVSCSMMITRNSHCSKNTHAHTRQKNENYKIVKSKDEMEKYDNKLDRWAAAAKSNNINNRQQSDEHQQQARIWCVVCIGIWKTRIFLFPFNIWAAGQLISWLDALSAVSVAVSWDLTLSLCVCVRLRASRSSDSLFQFIQSYVLYKFLNRVLWFVLWGTMNDDLNKLL